MRVEAATRRANRWLFVGLVAFAFLLCALVLIWMRARTHSQGGKVYPPVTLHLFRHPERKPQAVAEGLSGGRQTPLLAHQQSEGSSAPFRTAQDDEETKIAC